ncbi:fibrinogen alpha chain [Elysia marginata]|uniref:Fibrinogen alpha chain n=1 Tax=Elysia marginata TaxID=1093978 RepID=A0AAV4FFF6_9GAST|nr:fibrinogen alpha chain [Elysia marginata]
MREDLLVYSFLWLLDLPSCFIPAWCFSICASDLALCLAERRYSGDLDFNRTWEEYKNGFGSLDAEFWLGNEALHQLTSKHKYELHFYVVGKGVYFFYCGGNITVGAESTGYRLQLENTPHSNALFSTFDRKNNETMTYSCSNGDPSDAQGWWYKPCAKYNLNGIWQANNASGLVFLFKRFKPYKTNVYIRRNG